MGLGGFWPVISALAGAAFARFASSTVVRSITGGIALGGLINSVLSLTQLREDARNITTGNTDPAAIEEAARLVGRMLGLDGSNVLRPMDRRTGQLKQPLYFHLGLKQGRAWWTDRYYSRKMTFLGRRRRGRWGWRRWRNQQPAGTTIVSS